MPETHEPIDLAFIVDDDEAYTYTTNRIIHRLKLCRNVMIFSNGQEALDHLNSVIGEPHLIPEVILLDINMPVMDGWEFLNAFGNTHGKLGRNVKVYLVSSSNDPEDWKRASEIRELTGFIIKPITEKEIQAAFGLARDQ